MTVSLSFFSPCRPLHEVPPRERGEDGPVRRALRAAAGGRLQRVVRRRRHRRDGQRADLLLRPGQAGLGVPAAEGARDDVRQPENVPGNVSEGLKF